MLFNRWSLRLFSDFVVMSAKSGPSDLSSTIDLFYFALSCVVLLIPWWENANNTREREKKTCKIGLSVDVHGSSVVLRGRLFHYMSVYSGYSSRGNGFIWMMFHTGHSSVPPAKCSLFIKGGALHAKVHRALGTVDACSRPLIQRVWTNRIPTTEMVVVSVSAVHGRAW